MPRRAMQSRIRSWVPSSEPVSTITHELMKGATESSTSWTMCASFRTIMFRQIAGRAVTESGTARSGFSGGVSISVYLSGPTRLAEQYRKSLPSDACGQWLIYRRIQIACDATVLDTWLALALADRHCRDAELWRQSNCLNVF